MESNSLYKHVLSDFRNIEKPRVKQVLVPLDLNSSDFYLCCESVLGDFQLLDCAIYTNRCLMKVCQSFLSKAIFFECCSQQIAVLLPFAIRCFDAGPLQCIPRLRHELSRPSRQAFYSDCEIRDFTDSFWLFASVIVEMLHNQVSHNPLHITAKHLPTNARTLRSNFSFLTLRLPTSGLYKKRARINWRPWWHTKHIILMFFGSSPQNLCRQIFSQPFPISDHRSHPNIRISCISNSRDLNSQSSIMPRLLGILWSII